jgi:hypothetical protein
VVQLTQLVQWRIDHVGGVAGWLVIEGLGSASHQPAIREAYGLGHIVDGPAELVMDDDEYGAAMRYPVLRIKGGPGQVPLPRSPEDSAIPLPASVSVVPGDAGGRYRT